MQPVPGSALPQSAVGGAAAIPMAADFDGHARRSALNAGPVEAAGQEQDNAPAHVMGAVLGSALAPALADHTMHHCTDGSVHGLGAGLGVGLGCWSLALVALGFHVKRGRVSQIPPTIFFTEGRFC